MTKELEEQLYKKYPNLFIQRRWSIQESAMGWGFQCDDGWYELIDVLCSKLSSNVEATTVKEKFGGLRFYINNGTDKDYELIFQAQRDSYRICESCGSTNQVKQTKGWISTLCKKCLKDKKVKIPWKQLFLTPFKLIFGENNAK